MPSVTLRGRTFLRLSGREAEPFLQGLITTDLPTLPESEVRPGALLTPQGKILFFFFIRRDGTDAFLLETAAEEREALTRRLTLYRLRAAVEIAVADGDSVTVAWEPAEPGAPRDARFAAAGLAVTRRPGGGGADDPALYDALRIEAGLPEAGADYAISDAFPHDALLDLSAGLSFRKGCYVGQEVVSRMQHRGTARRRPVVVSADGPLPASGTALTAGGRPLGTLGTVASDRGLAIVRLDRAADAGRAGTPVMAGDVPVTLSLPAWTGLAFPQTAEAEP